MNNELLNELIKVISELSREDSLWKVLAPSISTILGALLTGFLAFMGVSWQVSKNQNYSDKLFYDKKREDIYLLVNKHKKMLERLKQCAVIDRALLRKELASITNTNENIQNINMIISIYLGKIHKERQLLNDANKLLTDFYYDFANGKIHGNGVLPENEKDKLYLMHEQCVEILGHVQERAVNYDKVLGR